jgi:hypothetical protein
MAGGEIFQRGTNRFTATRVAVGICSKSSQSARFPAWLKAMITLMRMRSLPALAIAALAFAGCFGARGAADQAVPYPEGYRHWTYLHSSLIGPKLPGFWKQPCDKPCTAGIFNFYANEKAMTGLRSGEYADGAIIAEELLEMLGSPSGGGKEGERRLVGVMVKDSQRYASTGGWGFGSYDGDSREDNLDSVAKTACFTCHIPRKDHGYVFTGYKER